MNWKTFERTLNKNLPTIAMAIGIGGFITAGVYTAYATTKACRLLDKKREELGRELTKKEIVQTSWKFYISPVAIALVSSACVIGGMSTSVKRNAALATAYSITDTTLREYRKTVKEEAGEEHEKDIYKSSVRNAAASTVPQTVLTVNNDGVLCLDSWTGRYFKIDLERLKKAENYLNRMLIRDGSVSLNDYYDEIGLKSVYPGNDLGWNIDKGLIEFEYDSLLTEDGRPCLVISFTTDPYYPF